MTANQFLRIVAVALRDNGIELEDDLDGIIALCDAMDAIPGDENWLPRMRALRATTTFDAIANVGAFAMLIQNTATTAKKAMAEFAVLNDSLLTN